MLNDIVEIAQAAGQAIMQFYSQDETEVQRKQDNSPVTEADMAAHNLIIEGLGKISDLPVVSEESFDPNIPPPKTDYWLVDPLDGTKEFIKRRQEFTVNIALIRQGHPVLGVIDVPAVGETFWAEEGRGSFKDGNKISNDRTQTDFLVAAGSRFHGSEKIDQFQDHFGVKEIRKYGSSLKFCRLAEGDADLYIRLKPTSEWDTAAGQIIALEAGCEVVNLLTLDPVEYSKPGEILNPPFVAFRSNLHIKPKDLVEFFQIVGDRWPKS